MYLYYFYYYPVNHVLYMELWEENPDGSTEYIRRIPVDNIGHGFSLLEKYRENGEKVRPV